MKAGNRQYQSRIHSMTDPDPLPLISGNDCSPVPVFNCQIILSKGESDQKIVGRVANLAGISITGNTERDVLMQIAKVFRAQVQALSEERIPVPWIDPPEQPGPGESQRFLPIHL
jgi:hypothetical protein